MKFCVKNAFLWISAGVVKNLFREKRGFYVFDAKGCWMIQKNAEFV